MPLDESYDETYLFRQIAESNEVAFRKVVHHYYPKLLTFITKITKTAHTAEELVQEVFLKLWMKRESIQHDNLGGWLHTVAANLAYNYLRRAAMEGEIVGYLRNSQPDYTHAIETNLDLKESEMLISKAISQLPPQQQIIYKLSKEEGLSRDEIAKQLNISPNTVKNHLLKAIISIKDFMKNAANL
jgi:RNA polymerase sigma-70 factor (family 1)